MVENILLEEENTAG